MKSNLEIETELGIIFFNQIEELSLFSIEIFPTNQSKESFEKAEFNNISDIKNDKVFLKYYPKEWTKEQWEYMEKLTKHGIAEILEENDFCDICGEEIEGNSCYREDENEHICEECYINWLIERKEKEKCGQ